MAREGGWFNRISASVASLREAMRAGRSMRVAVLVYLLSLAGILMLGIVLLLSAAGAFGSGREAQKNLMANDLAHSVGDISADFGAVSAVCASYAKLCARDLEARMLAEGFRAKELRDNPEALGSLLNGAYAALSTALIRSRASGAFLLLDATVNPALEGSADSRACVYLRNMEPNIVNATDPNLQLLRGPASVARDNGIGMHAQWRMELDVPHDGALKQNLDVSAQSGLPVSHAYFWQGASILEGTSERAMLCVAPLIASDGTLFGACGFEVSAMLFSLSYAPDNRLYPQSFVLIAPSKGASVELSSALTAGGGMELNGAAGGEAELYALERRENGFVAMEHGGRVYAGLARQVALYPGDSPFREKAFTIALMMPRQTLMKSIRQDLARLMAFLLLLMAAALFASLYMSRRFTRPLNESLETLRAADETAAKKTGIREIDELISSVKAAHGASDAAVAERERYALLSGFAQNVATLTAAERAVFDLYYEGYAAEEIAQKLFLSINTIKTHSKRIYMKLNVSSRKELLVYAAMLKEEAARERRETPIF
ncbi:MAG: LuxR C-terminal-related transcriptional regulator [Eubacteriales bacterium]|nr:LuxR C-terminal-related transcriptional regulator [Eubacteriales bacterium]